MLGVVSDVKRTSALEFLMSKNCVWVPSVPKMLRLAV